MSSIYGRRRCNAFSAGMMSVFEWMLGIPSGVLLLALLAMACLFSACSSASDSSGSDTAVADAVDARVGDAVSSDTSISDTASGPDVSSDALVGAFQVVLAAPVTTTGQEADGYTSVVGKVYDGPTPEQIIWEAAASDGACRLLKPRVPFCTQSCGSSAACVEDNQCQAYPTAHGVGQVLVKGVLTSSGATEFTLDPVANGYQTTDVLPYPAFEEGDDISVTAAGSIFAAAFTLKAKGILPVELLNETITLQTGNALTLTWNSTGQSGISTIFVKLDISHHGGSKGKIECYADDTGTLTLSSTLLDQLIALGAAGFPTIVLERRAVGSATISAGRVDLTVYSQVEKAVAIPGLTSCNDNDGCPEGQTCQDNLTCQ